MSCTRWTVSAAALFEPMIAEPRLDHSITSESLGFSPSPLL